MSDISQEVGRNSRVESRPIAHGRDQAILYILLLVGLLVAWEGIYMVVKQIKNQGSDDDVVPDQAGNNAESGWYRTDNLM